MSNLSRIIKLESKKKSDEFVLFLELDSNYIKQVNGINEYLTKEEFERQSKDSKIIEFI